ncbi:Trafficking protein particle complex subunit 12 [Gracilariopsis chorda]|uniref:Trafficking protein particle complex subunit 12 n=1 Tax=Gracilariopsis chorda TaxID=448386 RepID=A0A2V3IHL0_9FLOR|nr:Trafficking protein particle complex subunit 12 [Gracilariopsis chorda]|eukprot:PXF41549.1 Trafficking protein particle complex subunit 12 [Gracilariopsis chorda]
MTDQRQANETRRDNEDQHGGHQANEALQLLHQLSAKYQWVSVLQHASTLRMAEDDGSLKLLPHQQLHVAAYRILALLQTRQLERATAEISALGTLSEHNPKYRYESYAKLYAEARCGSFVPFCLHVVALEAAIRRGEAGAVDAIHAHAARVSGVQRALLLSCAACAHARVGQMEASVEVVLQLVRENYNQHALQTLSRALLAVGDVECATNVVDSVATRDATLDALLSAVKGEYAEALARYQSECGGGKTAVSNGAVCLLHLGRLEEAVRLVETAVLDGGEDVLDEGVLFNLATMYELAEPEGAAGKKSQLANVASQRGRQGFDVQLLNR